MKLNHSANHSKQWKTTVHQFKTVYLSFKEEGDNAKNYDHLQRIREGISKNTTCNTDKSSPMEIQEASIQTRKSG